jgi:hypothetical protein
MRASRSRIVVSKTSNRFRVRCCAVVIESISHWRLRRGASPAVRLWADSFTRRRVPFATQSSDLRPGQRARCPRGGIPARVMNRVMNQARSRSTLETVSRIVNNVEGRHGKAGVAAILRVDESDLPTESTRRGRPPARTVVFYREFAKRFAMVEDNRGTGASTRRILARHNGVPESTIANWVRRCRSPKLALLPPTRARRRGIDPLR